MAQNNMPIGLVGAGECASALVQGIHSYANGANDLAGLSHGEMGGYRSADIQVVSAWDIDRRKVGRDVAEAIFAPPNCTARFCEAVGPTGAVVQMAPVLDGYPAHMAEMTPDRRF